MDLHLVYTFKPNPMNTLQSIRQRLIILFTALLFGQVSFGLVVLLMLKPEPQNKPEEPIFMAVSSALLFVGIVAGMIISRKRLAAIRELDITQQIQPYTAMCIVRYALMEGPILFSIVALLLTGNEIFTVFMGVGFAYFLILFPGNGRISRELGISDTI